MHRFADKLLLVVLAGAIGIMSIRLFAVAMPVKAEKSDSLEGVSYLAYLEGQDVSEKEAEVIKAKKSVEAKNDASTNKTKTKSGKIDSKYLNADFKKVYKKFIISGDSIVKAINEYGILNKKIVRAEIGASTYYLADDLKNIVKAKPKYIVLHYGENDIGNKEHAKYFIKNYKASIKKLKKKLPKAKIFVDSIFPVLPKAYEDEPDLKNINYYNSLIKKMAKELEVTYIDFSSEEYGLFDDESYYDADGIHPVRSFYTEEYLPYILMKAGVKLD